MPVCKDPWKKKKDCKSRHAKREVHYEGCDHAKEGKHAMLRKKKLYGAWKGVHAEDCPVSRYWNIEERLHQRREHYMRKNYWECNAV